MFKLSGEGYLPPVFRLSVMFTLGVQVVRGGLFAPSVYIVSDLYLGVQVVRAICPRCLNWIQGYKDVYLPVTLKYALEFVLVMFHSHANNTQQIQA